MNERTEETEDEGGGDKQGGIYPARLKWTHIPCNVSSLFIFSFLLFDSFYSVAIEGMTGPIQRGPGQD